LKRAREFLIGIPDDLTVEDCKITVGIRPVPDDGQSIADIFPGTENFFLLVTHSGVTLAPALGELMAEFICTGERPNELETFSLKRFPGFS
jgi:glycine/D-amino acid oxidase-like deaminating enzyme